MTNAFVPAGSMPRGLTARLLTHLANLLPYLYAASGVIAVWWAVVLVGKPHVSLLPSPLLTARTLVQLLVSGDLPRHAGHSVFRVVAAWSIAAIVAVPLGFAMGRGRGVGRLVRPGVARFPTNSALGRVSVG